MAQVLAVISGKGGTGKTSLCAGVASCLAMEGQRVLCVDLDVGLRNLDIALGMADMAVLPFTSVMRGEYSLQQASQHPTIGNLSMLTAPVTESAEAVDTEAFERLITQARDGFDWILLDARRAVGRLFRDGGALCGRGNARHAARPCVAAGRPRTQRSFCAGAAGSRHGLWSTGLSRSCLPVCARRSTM